MLKNNNYSPKQINIVLFVILIEFFFLLILYKVVHVPITHDETATTVHYCNFSYWQIMMYPDNWPNNHILNTILTKFLISHFSPEQCMVRLPNLLSFLIYAIAILRINKSVLKLSSVFFIPATILFLFNPYFLDFFGLCRGYAMSCAFCALSVSYLITGYMGAGRKHIWLAFILAILASYANFTLLVFWIAVICLVWFYFLIQFITKKERLLLPSILLILFSIAYAALIAVPIIKMQSTNQFQYWQILGFYKGTIVSLVEQSLYGSTRFSTKTYNALSWFVVAIVFGNLLFVIIKFIKSKSRFETLKSPVFVASAAIFLTGLISMLQCKILHTPNLNGRTALFFFPLFIITLITAIGLIPDKKAKLLKGAFSLVLCIMLLFQTFDTYSLKYVREWWFDANTFDVIDYFNKTETNKHVSLKTNWLFQPSFFFYKYTGKIPFIDLKDYDKNIDVNTDATYYYINVEDFPVLESKFEVVYKINNERWLLKRKL
jgi:hypothetical protein